MKKRVLSLLMALVLCFSMLPTAALAEDAGAVQEIQDAADTGDIDNSGDVGGTDEGEDSGDVDAPEGEDGEDTGDNGDTEAQDDKAQDTGNGKAPDADVPDSEADTAVLTEQVTLPVEGGKHTAHCVCGGTENVNGHEHDSATTEWNAADSLPNSAGSYYLAQPVTSNWTVPTGEVKLCLNGQTITGNITVGSGAKLTLTDCSNSGKVQGEVTVNGGTLELYDGTITGGVQVGMSSNPASGSAFTMYGGAISGHNASSGSGGGVFLVGTTNSNITAPSFTMHGGTISNNTAGASDGGGGGVYVGEKCSFTMDGGTITGNTASGGNGGGIYIHVLSFVTISGGEITKNATTGDNIDHGNGGGIYSPKGLTAKNVTITENTADEGGGIYASGDITLTDATVTNNNTYDIYLGVQDSDDAFLTVSGSVKIGYYANYEWKLPVHVSGTLTADSVIRVGVRDGIKPAYGSKLIIAEPASDVTLSASNFKTDAGDCVTSLGEDGKVYLARCAHEMDNTGYTCSKCKTQFDARVGGSDYYQTLKEAFSETEGGTVTLLRDVTLNANCSAATDYNTTLDLNGKAISSEDKHIGVGGGNNAYTLTIKNSGTNGGAQALEVKLRVSSNGTLAVDDSYAGDISCVELQAGGALERFGGKIGELVLSDAANGSTSTGYSLKLWKDNANACVIGKLTDSTTSKTLTVSDLLGTDYAKCELYGKKDDTWSMIDKSTKLSELTDYYAAYRVQFPECVHACSDDSNPVCSKCGKELIVKIIATASDGATKMAWFPVDSAIENGDGYVEAIQTLNDWRTTGYTEPTLTLLRDMPSGTSLALSGTLTLEGGTHTAHNVTVDENANVTFASGSYKGATINGTATVENGVTFTDTNTVTVNGTLNVKGGDFTGVVKFENGSTANISGGSFTNDKLHLGVTFGSSVTGTISGGTFVYAEFYATGVKLSGGTFTGINISGSYKLADLLAEGAAYYTGNIAVSDDAVTSLDNVTVVSHTHKVDGTSSVCSVCNKQMTASLTVGSKTSWYVAFASAIEAANATDGEKTITLYQDVNGYVNGKSTTYELTRGPVTLATGEKTVKNVKLIVKGISLTVTGTGTLDTVRASGSGAVVENSTANINYITAEGGGRLELSGGSYKSLSVKDDSSGSLSGGSYGTINGDSGYVKPYALLAKGYAYKTTAGKWVTGAIRSLSNVTVEEAHEHAVNNGGENVTWTPIDSETALRSITNASGEPVYYYLTQDITLNGSSWAPVNGMVLDLNGKSITANGAFDTITVNSGVHFTLTDCKGGGENYGAITHYKPDNNTIQRTLGRGVMVSAGGHFIMYGGCIGPNLLEAAGAGVYVAEGAAFTMLGGMVSDNTVSAKVNDNGGGIWTAGTTTIGGDAKITGNRAQAGGGVYVSGGTLTLQGNAAVKNNSSTNGYNSGIFVSLACQLYVSGSVQVAENTNGNTGGNVYLEPDSNKKIKAITVIGELTDASIKVSFLNDTLNTISDRNPMTIAEADTAGWIKDDSFVLDGQSTHKLYISENGKAVELGTHPHEWEYKVSSDEHTIQATCKHTGCTVSGGSVTISVANDTYTYDGSERPAALEGAFNTGVVPKITYEVKKIGQSFTALPAGETVPTNAGQYKASITMKNTGANAKDAVASVDYTIDKATLTADDFTFTPPANLTYDGNPKIATVTTNKTGVGFISVTNWYAQGGGFADDACGVGSYVVKIWVDGSTNYHAITDSITGEKWTFEVKPTTQYTVHTPESWKNEIEVIEGSTLGDTILTITNYMRDTVTVTGVKDESLAGTVSWYTDEACTKLVDYSTNTKFEGVGSTVNLYWKFVFTDGGQMQNYVTKDETGSVAFRIKAGAQQGLVFKDAGGAPVTAETKNYGSWPFSLYTPNGTDPLGEVSINYKSSDPTVATVTNNGGGQITVTIYGVGTTTITATAARVDGQYAETTATYTLTVEQGEWGETVTVAMPGYTYNGNVKTPSLFNYGSGDHSAVTYYYSTTNTNSGGTKWEGIGPTTLEPGTYYMYAEIAETTNYKAYTTAASEFVVYKAIPTCNAPSGLTATYGQTLKDITLTNPEGNTPGTWRWEDGTQSVGDASDTPKTFTAIFTPDDETHYETRWRDVEVKVNPAVGGSLGAGALTLPYGDSDEHTYAPDWSGLPKGQEWNYGSSYTLSENSAATVTHSVENATGKLTYTISGGKASDVITFTLKAQCNNYEDFTITLTITITKATTTGTPGYTKITSSGKTLKDAGLTTGTLNPSAGTLEWVDKDGNVLGSDTKVEANKTYKWRFTPKDTNYGVLNGEIELYHRSSGYYYYPTDTGTGTKPSADTGDAGLLPYAVTALMSYTGTAALLRRRKRED